MFDPPMEMPGSNELARAEHELATLRALYAEAVRALAMATAPQSCDGGGSFTAFHFDTEGNEIGSEYVQCPGCCACASESTRAVLSRPEAQSILKGESRG